MYESILLSIKKMLGIDELDISFDTDIIIDINTALMILFQLGVGSTSYHITGNTETWNAYLGEHDDLEAIKTYIYMKTKLMFDPPLSSAVIEAMNRMISELEWRLNVSADSATLS